MAASLVVFGSFVVDLAGEPFAKAGRNSYGYFVCAGARREGFESSSGGK